MRKPKTHDALLSEIESLERQLADAQKQIAAMKDCENCEWQRASTRCEIVDNEMCYQRPDLPNWKCSYVIDRRNG